MLAKYCVVHSKNWFISLKENVFKFKILRSISLKFLFVTRRPQQWNSELLFLLSQQLFCRLKHIHRLWFSIQKLRTLMALTFVPTIRFRLRHFKLLISLESVENCTVERTLQSPSQTATLTLWENVNGMELITN